MLFYYTKGSDILLHKGFCFYLTTSHDRKRWLKKPCMTNVSGASSRKKHLVDLDMQSE